MQILRMLLNRPDKKNVSTWNGHFWYACITPDLHLSYMGKIDLSRANLRLQQHWAYQTRLGQPAAQ